MRVQRLMKTLGQLVNARFDIVRLLQQQLLCLTFIEWFLN